VGRKNHGQKKGIETFLDVTVVRNANHRGVGIGRKKGGSKVESVGVGRGKGSCHLKGMDCLIKDSKGKMEGS